MPYGNSQLDALYERHIRPVARSAGFALKRVDEVPSTRSILDDMFRMIRSAHLVVFFAAEQNLNTYYEAGYAKAHDKEVITIANGVEDLPFNVRTNNYLSARDPEALERAFVDLLVALRGV